MIEKSKFIRELELISTDMEFIEPYNILIDSLNHEANLGRIGQIAVEYQLKQHINNRILIDKAYSLKNHSVSKPLIVIGLPRSGTTFLFNLLSKDQDNRSPLFWEMMKPFPLLNKDGFRKKVRILQSDLILFIKERFIPNLDNLHKIKSTSPEECLLIKVFGLQSILYFYMANVPTYLNYLSNCDTTISYSWHHKFLSILENHLKPARWLLKDPSHLGNLKEILSIYPNACFIHITRDPAETIPSICSLTAQVRKGFSKDLDTKRLGKDTLNFWAKSNDKNEAQRSDLSSNQYMQVQYDDLLDDPINLIKDIYKNFSISLNDRTLSLMNTYIEEGSSDAKAEHKYSLEDYGLERAEVHNKLKYS